MDFKSFLKIRTRELNKQVNLELIKWEKEVVNISPELKSLTKAFINSCQGGKRLRGLLVELGFELAANTFSKTLKNEDILKVAVAYEIFHAAILIHDDIIDQSKTRRGIATLFKKLGNNHYGISQAISLGDIGFFLSIRNIAESNFPPENKTKALAFFAKVIMDTGLGELLDVEAPLFKEKYNPKDVMIIHSLKTAAYTISGPLILGAILARGSEELIRKLKQFGHNLGLAYQIQDDYLGVFGKDFEIGKSTTSDIEEGKNTLLISFAKAKATLSQQAVLNKYYGKKALDQKAIYQIKQIFIDTGSIEYSKYEAEKYIKTATAIIPKLTDDKNIKEILFKLSKYLIDRES